MANNLVVHESEGEVVPDICGTAVELINATNSSSTGISFAKIIVNPGKKSRCHFHKFTEEVYYITSGTGLMIIDNKKFNVKVGHAIFLPIGSKHQIINTGNNDLVFVCADAPIFDPEDVFEVED